MSESSKRFTRKDYAEAWLKYQSREGKSYLKMRKNDINEVVREITKPITVRNYDGSEGTIRGKQFRVVQDLNSATRYLIPVDSGTVSKLRNGGLGLCDSVDEAYTIITPDDGRSDTAKALRVNNKAKLKYLESLLIKIYIQNELNA